MPECPGIPSRLARRARRNCLLLWNSKGVLSLVQTWWVPGKIMEDREMVFFLADIGGSYLGKIVIVG